MEQFNISTIYFANIFETKSGSEEIDTISIPVYECENAEIYINSTSGELNSSEYELLKIIENPENGYATIYLEEPITIESESFVIAVKYTGEAFPVRRYR